MMNRFQLIDWILDGAHYVYMHFFLLLIPSFASVQLKKKIKYMNTNCADFSSPSHLHAEASGGLRDSHLLLQHSSDNL